MGFAWGYALLFAGTLAVVSAITSAIRTNAHSAGAAVANFLLNFFITGFIDLMVIMFVRPMLNLPGLALLIFLNILFAAVYASIVDFVIASGDYEGVGAATVLFWIGLVVFGVIWSIGHNSGHNAYKASHLVRVVEEKTGQPPASSTAHMKILSTDQARVKASNAMSSGEASTRNFQTYLNLGPATLQMVQGRLWYVFPLMFDGAINKHRLHGIEPGYIMINAEDPTAEPVERYDGIYSMIVSLGAGQGGQPDRWAYDHGWIHYLLRDPTLEIRDDGAPFYTLTLLKPRLGWTFDAPVGVLVINAHTGQIVHYNPGNVPQWIDRVYSEQMAKQIANWYGFYGHAPFGGRGNTNRYKISGDPVMVYTGGEHPSWRMLETSYGAETSTYRVIEMDSHTGAMRVYKPLEPMGTEDTVYEAFQAGSGVGAQMIRANHYQPVDLSLHVIYGHLTWMVTYEPEGSHPSFVGLGFVDAYHVAANNVAFGSAKSQALQNYLQQLSQEQNANGNAPGAGGQYVTVTGTVASVAWDIQGGTKYYYFTLNGPHGKPDETHVYSGTSSLGPAIVLAEPGDHVKLRVLKITQNDSQQTLQYFSDAQHPLTPAGS